ncbi:hypothetical protein EB795_27730 [Pseudomonas mandelii]|nr:hypothetical protein [Pseudomonas mandelii]
MSLNVGAQTCLKQWISKWESMAEIDGVWDDAIASRLTPTGDLWSIRGLGGNGYGRCLVGFGFGFGIILGPSDAASRARQVLQVHCVDWPLNNPSRYFERDTDHLLNPPPGKSCKTSVHDTRHDDEL